MKAARAQSPLPHHVDQRVRLHGASWAQYESLLAVRGESSVPRMTYLEGELELMTPSWDHEAGKTTFARLIEAWADELGLELVGIGSWTIKAELKERGAEPDECYLLGVDRARKEIGVPDIAVEVVWTSGGLPKLEVNRERGVPDVGFFEEGRLSFHRLERRRYLRATRSRVLPALDPRLIEESVRRPSQIEALRHLRATLRKGAKRGRRGRRG